MILIGGLDVAGEANAGQSVTVGEDEWYEWSRTPKLGTTGGAAMISVFHRIP